MISGPVLPDPLLNACYCSSIRPVILYGKHFPEKHMKIETNFYTITPYANLLYIETFSSWDDRVMKLHFEDVTRLARELFKGRPWAILVDKRQWELNTPEAQNIGEEHPINPVVENLSHVALVTGDSALKGWLAEDIAKKALAGETRLFKEMEAAEDWLASAGFTKTPLANKAL